LSWQTSSITEVILFRASSHCVELLEDEPQESARMAKIVEVIIFMSKAPVDLEGA